MAKEQAPLIFSAQLVVHVDGADAPLIVMDIKGHLCNSITSFPCIVSQELEEA